MITINLTGIENVRQFADGLKPDRLEKMQRAGIAYASKTVAVTVAKGIRQDYNIKAARIKDDISPPRFSDGGLAATIRFSRRPPTLAQFNPKPGTRGRQPGLGRGRGWGPPNPAGKPVSVIIRKSQGRQQVRGAFIAAGASGNRLVFKTDSNGKLQALYGPSVGSIYAGKSALGERLRQDVQNRIERQYEVGFNRALEFAMRGTVSAGSRVLPPR